jgi:hypothetical protein
MRTLGWLLIAVLALYRPAAAPAGDISGKGQRLGQALDAMDVEHLWLPGRYVNWETGRALKRRVTDGKPHTHCSAFVAAACKRLGVYILRPPDHSETLLANAQYDWLREEGRRHGWKPVRDPHEAQHFANKGYLVVATYKNHSRKRPGHIALVRPSTRGDEVIEHDGPAIIQAGGTNFNRTSLARGFRGHPSAWRDREVRFYAHAWDGTFDDDDSDDD